MRPNSCIPVLLLHHKLCQTWWSKITRLLSQFMWVRSSDAALDLFSASESHQAASRFQSGPWAHEPQDLERIHFQTPSDCGWNPFPYGSRSEGSLLLPSQRGRDRHRRVWQQSLYMTHSKHGSDIMSFLRVLLVRSKSQAPHPPGTQGRQEAIQGHECSRQDRGGYLSALLVSSEAKNK